MTPNVIDFDPRMRRCKRCPSGLFVSKKGRTLCDACQAASKPARALLTAEDKRKRKQERMELRDEGVTFSALAAELRVTPQRASQLELRALGMFERHWHVLVTLANSAGIVVDWDWVFGRRDAPRFEL